jgi:hypothetical protein
MDKRDDMPINKTQLRRLSAIVHVLNHSTCNTEQLRCKVSELIDVEVCKSTIEKDLYHLRMEYDLDDYIVKNNGGRGGYHIPDKIDFITLLKNHLNLF